MPAIGPNRTCLGALHMSAFGFDPKRTCLILTKAMAGRGCWLPCKFKRPIQESMIVLTFSRRFGSVMRCRRKLGEQHAVVSRNGRTRIECTQEDCETNRKCRDSLSSDSAVARAIDAAQGRSADP